MTLDDCHKSNRKRNATKDIAKDFRTWFSADDNGLYCHVTDDTLLEAMKLMEKVV